MVAPSKLKKTLHSVMIIFVWTAGFLLALELATRFYLFGFDIFNYFKVNSFDSLGVSGLIKPSSHPEIIFELRPNLNTYFKIKRFKTNSEGLRDKEYNIEKPKNTFRAVVFGASSTTPTGVDIDKAFHSVLEDRLNRLSSNVSYEFLNFGIGSYDPRQALAALKYKALKYDPDLILFCFPFSQFKPEDRYRKVYNVKPRTHPFFGSFFKKLVQEKLKRRERDKRKRDIVEELPKLKDVYSQLSRISKTQNIPVCVVILNYDAQKIDFYYEKIMDISSEYGFYAIDTLLAFEGAGSLKKYGFSVLDGHPNAKAHKIFADVIYDYLIEQGLLKK